jgi:serine O-acetyltransferase
VEPRSYFVFIGDETAPFLNIALRAKKVVRNKNLKKSRQEARRGKMSFFAYFKEEFQVIQERDPAIHSPMEVLLYPSFRVMLKYRRAHKLYLKGHYFLARWISQRAARKTGIEIHPGATIGKGLFIDHGAGVIIGETTVIGDNVTLYQGVTLGGTGKDVGKRHPTLGNNVMVGSGAKILGPFKVGDNARIAANSVVLHEVPPDSTVVGVPGRVVRRNGEKLDHIHTPDPVRLELDALYARIEKIEEKLKEDQDVSL